MSKKIRENLKKIEIVINISIICLGVYLKVSKLIKTLKPVYCENERKMDR